MRSSPWSRERANISHARGTSGARSPARTAQADPRWWRSLRLPLRGRDHRGLPARIPPGSPTAPSGSPPALNPRGQPLGTRAGAAFARGCLLVILAAGPTAAQPPYHRWLAPPVEEQLAADPTEVPEGMGAIFVPALTDGESEPESAVFRGSRQVASGPNGSRIPVLPGDYTVRVGSGPIAGRVPLPAEVTAGETTVVPVRWGGLRVEVVDERNLPHGASFELIRVVDREVHVTGSGADTLEGERLRTLLLPEDLYRIVRRRTMR